MFGLTGAHRAGKTTLAKATAEALGIHFFEAKASQLMKERHGIELVSNMPPADRLCAQIHLLNIYLEQMKSAPRPAVTDRTPLDMAAYMLAEIGMHAGLPDEISVGIADYVDLCIRVTSQEFDSLFLIHPLPFYVVEEGKPAQSKAYQQHIHLLIRGLAHSTVASQPAFDIGPADVATRTKLIAAVIQNRLAQHRELMANVRVN